MSLSCTSGNVRRMKHSVVDALGGVLEGEVQLRQGMTAGLCDDASHQEVFRGPGPDRVGVSDAPLPLFTSPSPLPSLLLAAALRP